MSYFKQGQQIKITDGICQFCFLKETKRIIKWKHGFFVIETCEDHLKELEKMLEAYYYLIKEVNNDGPIINNDSIDLERD